MVVKIIDSEFKNETFEVVGTEDISHLKNLAKDLMSRRNIEPTIYKLKRVVEGTRKRAYTISCYKLPNGNYTTI